MSSRNVLHDVNFTGHSLRHIRNGVLPGDAVNKAQLDTKVGGSGTNKYLPLWDATGVNLTDSLLHQVTANTLTALARLDIQGIAGGSILGARVGAASQYRFKVNDYSTNGITLGGNMDSNKVANPTVTLTLAASTSGGAMAAGAYSYTYTFYTADGETNVGTNDNATIASGTSGSVAISGIATSADPRVIGRRIYRSKLGSTVSPASPWEWPGRAMWLVATIADNTSTTYTDTQADASLTNWRWDTNDTAGDVWVAGKRMVNYQRSPFSPNTSYVHFGPLGLTKIDDTGQIYFNNIQDNPGSSSYPSRQLGFTWQISSDAAGMFAREISSDSLDYCFWSGDNDSGDRFSFINTGTWNGKQSEKEIFLIYGDHAILNTNLTMNGDLKLNGPELQTVIRRATSTTMSFQDKVIDNTEPPPATNGLDVQLNLNGYSQATDQQYFVRVTQIYVNGGTQLQIYWREGGVYGDWSGMTGPVTVTGNGFSFNASSTGVAFQFWFNTALATQGILNQVWAFRMKRGSRLQVDYANQHYIMGKTSHGMSSNASALVHLAAGTASANTAPLKFNVGVNLTAVEPGAVEYDGNNLYITDNPLGGTRRTLLYADFTNVTGILSLSKGGTNANLTASNGAVPYSTGAALALLAPGTASQLFTSGGAGAPTWQNIASLLTAGNGIAISGTTNATIRVKHALTIPFVEGYTPVTGGDIVEWVIPYSPVDGTTSLTFNLRRLQARLGTGASSGNTSMKVEKSNATTTQTFAAGTIVNLQTGGDLTLASGTLTGANTTWSTATVSSGDIIRLNITAVGTGADKLTAYLILEEA